VRRSIGIRRDGRVVDDVQDSSATSIALVVRFGARERLRKNLRISFSARPASFSRGDVEAIKPDARAVPRSPERSFQLGFGGGRPRDPGQARRQDERREQHEDVPRVRAPRGSEEGAHETRRRVRRRRRRRVRRNAPAREVQRRQRTLLRRERRVGSKTVFVFVFGGGGHQHRERAEQKGHRRDAEEKRARRERRERG
jgi:hypothetical protein